MTPILSALSALPLVGWSVHATALRRRLTKARRDPLTALPTRDRFTAHAARLLRTRPALVVLVDLDRFKPLNDTHGHAAGDAALRAVAERLSAWARSGIAAQLGGDEFAAILPAPADPRAALAALHHTLTRPFTHQGQRLEVGASIGGYLATQGRAPGAALHHADTAMYQAKHHSGGWHLAQSNPATASAPRRWKRARPARALDPAGRS